jgi:predicted extracellular nuclease
MPGSRRALGAKEEDPTVAERAHPRHRLASFTGLLLVLTGLLPLAAPTVVLAAGSISLSGSTYAENFDTLATSGTTNTTLPVGWDISEAGGGARDNEQYAADTGASGTGDTYSYGAALSSERAYGGLQSGTLIPTIGASLTNATGASISSLSVGYTGEQWRLGALARPDRLDFQISTNATSLTTGTWADVDGLDFTAPTTGPTIGALDGNAASNRTPISFSIGSLAIPNGSTFWIRWTDLNATGADDGLAIDDLSITPTTADQAPFVLSTTPANGATNVPLNTTPSITFSEPVALDGAGVSLTCTIQGAKSATLSGGPETFTLTVLPFVNGDHCTIAVLAGSATDTDTNDPPDTMAADFAASFDTPGAPPVGVVISEVYGGGGNAGATLKNDFLELYNASATSVSLSGWSVQYAAAGGTSWQVTGLTGSIPAGRNYLVKEAAGATGTVELPPADATGTIPMSATAGKVALVSTTTALTGACPTANVVDFVGYGMTANCFEGTGPAPAPSNTTSDQRRGGGATDTDDNPADFVTGAPDPHASVDQAPTVASSTPATGTSGVPLAANVSITFSEPVTPTGAWFTISCSISGAHSAVASGGPVAFTLDPDANFASDETCTVTVVAANVSDQDTDDPPDTMAADATITFATVDAAVCGDPGVSFIHTIQGSGLSSPVTGSIVSIEGTVVGDYQQAGGFGGYYVEEEDSDFDADSATSEGIFVFSTTVNVSVGDRVRVKGTVTEFNSSGSLLTELSPVSTAQICSTGNPLPTPASVSLPVTNLTDWEPLEGMLVSLPQTLTVTEVFNLGRFGEVSLSGTGRLPNPTNVVAPGAPAIALEDLNDRSRIILDDGDNLQNIDPTHYPQGGLSAANTLRVGDSLPSLSGVVDQRFNNYRIQPVGPISFNHTNPRTQAPDPVGGNLRVASFNVLNFFNGNGLGGGFPTPRGADTLTEFNRQLAKEVSAITTLDADIVGLMELENDAPGNSAIEDLVAALNSATAPGTYAFINTGIVGTDEIRVGLLYRPAAVTPIGSFQTITTAVDPRFIDTKNRPSLAQSFESNLTGGRLTVVVNHLKSKGSDCNDVGDPDTFDGQGNCNLTRTNAAAAIADWLATDPTGVGDADYLLIGDMNSYAKEDPIAEFQANGFEDTINTHIGAGAYSYVFDGESGYLDHALASASLAAQVTGVAEWHINPDEPTALDYNTEFKTANQVTTFYDPGAYRSSDHDPVLVGIDLNTPPTVDAGGPYAVNSGSSVLVSATGNDPDGKPLAYAWDLDDNGSFETPGQSATFDASTITGPATLTIHVRATDAGGAIATDDATVVVNAHPTVDAGGPYTVVEGFGVTVSATGSDPEAGALTYAWDLDDNGSFETPGQTVTFNAPAGSAPASPTIRVRVTDPDGLSATDTATVRIIWAFGGPLSPLSNPPVENPAKAGSGLPIKFTLGGNQGLAVIAAGYPTSVAYTCGLPLGSRPTDATLPTASTGFTYDPTTSIYNYSWKTDKSWANTCRRFVLKLADGTFHFVDVHFTK